MSTYAYLHDLTARTHALGKVVVVITTFASLTFGCPGRDPANDGEPPSFLSPGVSITKNIGDIGPQLTFELTAFDPDSVTVSIRADKGHADPLPAGASIEQTPEERKIVSQASPARARFVWPLTAAQKVAGIHDVFVEAVDTEGNATKLKVELRLVDVSSCDSTGDSPATATLLADGVHTARICNQFEEHWYKVPVAAIENVEIQFTQVDRDASDADALFLYLVNPCGQDEIKAWLPFSSCMPDSCLEDTNTFCFPGSWEPTTPSDWEWACSEVDSDHDRGFIYLTTFKVDNPRAETYQISITRNATSQCL